MSGNNGRKRVFDEFPTVDCNTCELYYLNQCDGVQKGQERSCTSFKATRDTVIPQEIKWLKTRLKWLTRAFVCLSSVQVIITAIIILIYYFGII